MSEAAARLGYASAASARRALLADPYVNVVRQGPRVLLVDEDELEAFKARRGEIRRGAPVKPPAPAPAPAPEVTPEQLREARARLGLSQREMADRMCVSVRTYQGWEAGRTIPRRVAALLAAAEK